MSRRQRQRQQATAAKRQPAYMPDQLADVFAQMEWERVMPQCKVNAMSQAQLIKLLLDGDRTCAELAEESGLHYVTVLDYTRALHKAGAVHIARWDKDVRGRDILKIYKLGKGKDAKRAKLTGAQRQERTRNKRKAYEQMQVIQGRGQYVQAANGRLRFEAIHA